MGQGPGAGEGLYYLVRARNGCGGGSFYDCPDLLANVGDACDDDDDNDDSGQVVEAGQLAVSFPPGAATSVTGRQDAASKPGASQPACSSRAS